MNSPITRLGSAEEIPKQKIFLVYGVHLNEKAVTEYFAKTLKPLLDLQGFDVQIIEYPEKKSLQTIMQDKSHDEQYKLILSNLLYNEYMFELSSNNPNAIFFDLHATPEELYLRNMNIRKPRFWSARIGSELDIYKGMPMIKFIPEFLGDRGIRNLYSFEIPMKTKPSELRKYRNQEKKFDPYFDIEADLNATKNSGWISPRTIDKIIHLILRINNTHIKQYRLGYKMPYKTKYELRKDKIRESIGKKLAKVRALRL